MASYEDANRTVISKSIVLLILIAGLRAAFTVAAIPKAINAIATYTWAINFNAGTPRNPLTLTFPSQLIILSNVTVTIGGIGQNFTVSSNTITITSSISAASISVVVGNVQNPPSAISTLAFSYFNTPDGTVSLTGQVNQVQYQAGTLASCPWSFSHCTERPLSDLMVTITTINRLSLGNKYFLIGYTTTWPNHYSKGLVTNTGTLTCSYSTDNGTSYTPGTSCTIDALNNRIDFLFSVTGIPIPGGTTIIVKVSGINTPPTVSTSTNTNYFIYTADGSLVKIDGLTSCAISNVCITNQIVGTFSNTTMRVNGNYSNPNITFPLTPLTITIQPSDSIEIYFSPFSSLLTCNTLIIYRSGSPLYTLTSPASGSNSITFTFPVNNGYNTEYNYPFYIYMQCASFLLPPSETPVTLAFIFKRNSDTFLHLNSTISASATTFNSSKGTLSLSSTAMVANAGYTFNFLLGQQLGTSAAIALTFPTDFVIASPSCTVSILALTVSLYSCTFINTTNTVRVLLTTGSTIASGSNVTILINGITNPSSPKAYSIAMNTYYDSAVSTSRVETSLTAFSTTITQISNYPIALTPIGLTVYSSTSIILSFIPTIIIPALSTFNIQFPSGVSNLLPTTNLLMVGGVQKPLNGGLTTTSTNVTFSSGMQIAAGSNVTITVPLTTPSNIGTYSFVKVIISNNSTNYLTNKNNLYLNVNSVNTMSVIITPLNPITGTSSAYKFDLSLTIPHSTTFIVQFDVPTDTKFISSNASCTSCVNGSLAPITNTSFSFTASNPSGPTNQLISFTISSFTNPRSVGNSLAWGISTKTVTPTNLISYTTSTAKIQTPNTLTASLAKNDSYYRSNTSPVKMTVGFFNQLATNDYILISFNSDSYTASSVSCSSIYGVCSVVGVPSNVTVVKIIPNTTSIISKSLFLILEGLTSAAGSGYAFITSITVTTLTSTGALIDSGTMAYNISCGLFPSNICKQCYINGSCINCYPGYYLQGNVCVSVCGPPTLYMSYANSSTGTCVTCINNCEKCDTDTICRSCITNYYLFYIDSSCKLTCPTTLGYYISGFICYPCVSNCLECANGSNSCTRCDNATLLISGTCMNGCGSTSYYQLNGNCIKCDESCYNCSGPGSGSCYLCNSSYHLYLTQCVGTCPNGTAINPTNGDCGCSAECLTCSNYASCTACLNSSLWAMNGACIDSCPISTYPLNGQCVSCSAGCLNCTISTCTTCVSTNYLFNNSCFSDCNLINQQYDVFGNSCVLCPSGCDSCSGTNCTTCLDAYTLVSTQCIKTCLLSNTCDLTAQVLPMPGLLSLVVWVGITVVIHLLYHKNYLPYSIILLSGIIQFVLVLALISSLSTTTSRLLATDNAYQAQMRGLLGGAIAVNYLQNIAYIIIFICYIKPLIANPRQIDVISNIVVLVIGTLTNFRFGLVAFARLFPKPNIYVQTASKLTPIHYLCLISLVFDLLPVVACGLGLINSQKLTNTFMLSLDLLIVIVINIAMTIWFVAASKPDSYFQDFVKKYHIEDNAHNPTDQTLPNEKNLSKANMVGNQSINFDDFDRTENDDSYNKFTPMKIHNSTLNNLNDQSIKENPLPITVSKNRMQSDPFIDPNFEENIKSKRSATMKDSMVISKADFAKNIDKEGKSVDQNLSARKGHVISGNFSRDPKSDRKRVEPQKNIIEVEESDYPDLQEKSAKDPGNVFNSKQRMAKPKKLKQGKGKAIQQPMKLMKKGDKRVGYFESDAYDSNVDGEDLEEIIKQKIWQSTIKLQKPSIESGRDEETAHEEISPSWFNAQNQRLDITDLEDADPQ